MKPKQQHQTIDDYIADFPDEVQVLLERVRATIRKAAPAAQEAVKYGVPTFVLKGNLIHFGGFKNHIGLYPGPTAIAKFKNELVGYECSKGTVRFPLSKRIPFGLIGKITKCCVQQNLEKAAKKARKSN